MPNISLTKDINMNATIIIYTQGNCPLKDVYGIDRMYLYKHIATQCTKYCDSLRLVQFI
jgi:hypothetical protein